MTTIMTRPSNWGLLARIVDSNNALYLVLFRSPVIQESPYEPLWRTAVRNP
jgi:hypothetical protein